MGLPRAPFPGTALVSAGLHVPQVTVRGEYQLIAMRGNVLTCQRVIAVSAGPAGVLTDADPVYERAPRADAIIILNMPRTTRRGRRSSAAHKKPWVSNSFGAL